MKKIVYLFALLTLTLGLEGQNFHFEKVVELEYDRNINMLYAFDTKAFFSTSDQNYYLYSDGSFESIPYFNSNVSGFEQENGNIFAAYYSNNYESGEVYLWQHNTKKWQRVLEVENKNFRGIFVLNENNIYLWAQNYNDNDNKNGQMLLFNPQKNTIEEIIIFNTNYYYYYTKIQVKDSNNIWLLFVENSSGVWQKFNGENLEILHTFKNPDNLEEVKASPDTSTFFFLPSPYNKVYYWEEKEQKMDSISVDLPIYSFFPLDNENLLIFTSPKTYILNVKSGEKQELTEWSGIMRHSGYTGKNVAFSARGNDLYKITINNSLVEDKKINNIYLYPNPTNDILQLDCSIEGEKNIKIINTKGQVLIEKTFFDSNLNLDITSLSPGVYLTQIKTVNGTSNQKLIKN